MQNEDARRPAAAAAGCEGGDLRFQAGDLVHERTVVDRGHDLLKLGRGGRQHGVHADVKVFGQIVAIRNASQDVLVRLALDPLLEIAAIGELPVDEHPSCRVDGDDILRGIDHHVAAVLLVLALGRAEGNFLEFGVDVLLVLQRQREMLGAGGQLHVDAGVDGVLAGLVRHVHLALCQGGQVGFLPLQCHAVSLPYWNAPEIPVI